MHIFEISVFAFLGLSLLFYVYECIFLIIHYVFYYTYCTQMLWGIFIVNLNNALGGFVVISGNENNKMFAPASIKGKGK